MSDELKQLVTKLEVTLTDQLISVIMYGSGAVDEHDPQFSDVNILCVMKEITPAQLSLVEPVLRWWRERHRAAPLLMTEDEIVQSADSFPIEFRDMKDRRRVLYGMDVITELHVDHHQHRVQLEHELRSKLLRLRQHGALVLSDPEALIELCLESVTTFLVLGRHALMAAGLEAPTNRHAVVRHLAQAAETDMTPLETLIRLREDLSGDPGDPGELFAQYLTCVEQLVRFVDRLDIP